MGKSWKTIRWILICATVALACAVAGSLRARDSQASGTKVNSKTNPDSLLLPDSSKPTFTISEAALRKPVKVIAYGDIRFTNSKEKIATDPKIRMEIVRRVAKLRPDALLVDGDIPYHGGNMDDYAVFREETRIWRKDRLRVFPALGNHEFYGCAPAQCLENWWSAFPKLKGRRWYSVRLGANIETIALDSDDSFEPGSRQIKWLTSQLESLPRAVEFVLITMHHPPTADPIPGAPASEQVPRPNEIALRNYLKVAAQAQDAKIVVIAAHVHNYERFFQDDVMYLVSGGGGAQPLPVVRTPGDLYKSNQFPNYNYVEFVLEGKTLRGTMYRLSSKGVWQAKDSFQIQYK
ncbi:MAG: metallophosphoesterase family protein [Candidatus Acidiferrales bacterium]